MPSNKHLCVIAMPRTGSELLMNHLSFGLCHENAGEFLCNYKHGTVATDSSASGLFRHKYNLNPRKINPQETQKEFIKYIGTEFDNRIELLKSYDKPLIVKDFTSSSHFFKTPSLTTRLFDEFDIILLSRRDVMKSVLSTLICEYVGVYHYAGARNVCIEEYVKNSQILGDESLFIHLVKAHNKLDELINSVRTEKLNVNVVYFEDYESNPTEELNRIFNTKNPRGCVPALNKFIDDHEAPFSNIERLRELFNIYRVQPT